MTADRRVESLLALMVWRFSDESGGKFLLVISLWIFIYYYFFFCCILLVCDDGNWSYFSGADILRPVLKDSHATSVMWRHHTAWSSIFFSSVTLPTKYPSLQFILRRFLLREKKKKTFLSHGLSHSRWGAASEKLHTQIFLHSFLKFLVLCFFPISSIKHLLLWHCI